MPLLRSPLRWPRGVMVALRFLVPLVGVQIPAGLPFFALRLEWLASRKEERFSSELFSWTELSFSLESEESLNEFEALVLHDPHLGGGGVVHPWILVDVEGAAESSHFGVRYGEYDASYA